MTEVELITAEKFHEAKMFEKTEDSEDLPPSKKFKQGRLPFKPLDSCQTPKGTSPTGSKKRKLSDNESPSAKQLKTELGKITVQSPTSECDPEVSSSSEADTSLLNKQQKINKKVNTIDRFFKPKPDSPDQEEISSTNDCLTIDLTDDNSVDKVEVSKDGNAPDKNEASPVNDTSTKDEESAKVEPESGSDDNVEMEHSDSGETQEENESKDGEDKENISQSESEAGMDESFVSDVAVCENALKTPGKEKMTESGMKTPVLGSSKVTKNTPKSGSEGTPASGKKRLSISDSKKKERDAMRLKIKEEKEKEREEKRLQKEKEKEEKEKERLEKKKQKDAEKMEKERQKQEEKEKKEKERLEKLKQKEDEKKQKQKELETKMGEKKKKEEEKKQKEEEKKKEEEEKMKKEAKKKEMFKGFFIQKAPTSSPPKVKESNSIFMPFELKSNMKLAPVHRERLSVENKQDFDELFNKQDSDHLYLKSLKSSSCKPRKSPATLMRNLVDADDVEVLSHDQETIEKVTHHVKFLYFHENARPPYYGTWRKPSEKISPRNPFKQDELLFDYEVDSDDEWEEEEPGESVSSDEEEDEDKDKDEDEEDADGWMVPHGYLSDGEGIEDDEESRPRSEGSYRSHLIRVDSASKQDLQKVRQAAWESELKKQAKPLKMIIIGSVWEDDTTAIAAQQLETLLKYKAVCLTEGPIATSFSGARHTDTDSGARAEEKRMKLKRKSVPDEAMPDLIKLVHGNLYGIQKLMKEFRMFWKLKTNPDSEKTPAENNSGSPQDKDTSLQGTSMEVDSTVEKGESGAEKLSVQDDFAISKRQLEMKIQKIAVREKRPDYKKICWYVKDEVLKQYDMEDIKMPNSWEYVCLKAPKLAEERAAQKAEENASAASALTGRNTPTIKQFAQPMSPAMILAIGASKDQNKSQAVTETGAALAPEKEAAQTDQRTIIDMFSPASRKVGKSKISQTSASREINSATKSSGGSAENTSVASEKAETKVCTSPVLNLGSLFSVKPVVKSPSSVILIDDDDDDKSVLKAAVKTPVTPKQTGYSVIDTVLTSPELMKQSPKQVRETHTKLSSQQQSSKVEPMDVDDVIVLE